MANSGSGLRTAKSWMSGGNARLSIQAIASLKREQPVRTCQQRDSYRNRRSS